MSDREQRRLLAAVVPVAVLALLILLIPATWLFFAFDRKYRQCVALENGLNLGYEAVFDLGRPFFKPIAVPKFRDGTPLIRDDLWAIFVTDTSLYGVSLAVPDANGYYFAWRGDSGLIKQDQDPSLYDRLVREAGPPNWDIEIGSVGTDWLLNELIARPEFNVHRCPTTLITW